METEVLHPDRQGTSDVTISGNVFSGLEEQAVRADKDCRRLAVTGNVVIGVNRKSAGRLPALDLGGAKDSICQQNIVTEGELPSADATARPVE